jgi:hypothetical protein
MARAMQNEAHRTHSRETDAREARAAKAQSERWGRALTATGNPPSSAGRLLPPPADEVAGPLHEPLFELTWTARPVR